KEALKAIMADYNRQYGVNFDIGTFDLYYQDVQKRIKDQKYPNSDLPHDKKIDLTIVVDMLLTGFDSQYINPLQACLRPRDRFWDIPVPKIDSAFDNLFVPQPSWSPSTTQQLRKLVAAPYLAPNDWTPRLDAYFAYPLALCARRVSSAASRLLGTTSLRFALHCWQRMWTGTSSTMA
ncbi:type I restriction enzyme subunit R domain-containing protein, partial [Thiolapillus sp.]|uniref:type I restriction enzyme subunit R domain-containing protein n=2 Tax=Thiolapillus sp. TaxID=2017437 RepID=UPI003AF81B71